MSSDPYVYRGTTVLKNIPGICNQEILDRFEADRVAQRSLEVIRAYRMSTLWTFRYRPSARNSPLFVPRCLRMGRSFRTVDIAKRNSYFAHVPYIESTLKDLFGELSGERPTSSWKILGTLNAVHAFREGNGRAQRKYARELACKNSHWIDWNKVSREEL
jgi:cell filamentation protein, protein adenylyltransferase